MSTGTRSLELGASAPAIESTGGLSTSIFGDSAPMQFSDTSTRSAVAPVEGAIAVPSPYPEAVVAAAPTAAGPRAASPLLNAEIQQEVASAGEVAFTSPSENASSPPDYRLSVGDDGQLTLQKVGDGNALADGKLNIEIDPKNKSLQDAIKNADKNLKEYVREMMALWKESHPGKPHPGWWDAVLAAQPNVPADTQPVQTQRQPQSEAPRAAAPSNPAGFTPGGDFKGRGGFDNQGYFKGNGSSNEGSAWTGPSSSAPGQPVGPGEQAKAKDIYDYLKEKGFTPAQASGILGNLQTESSFNTGAYNKNENAIGLCQWQGDRRTQLESFASAQGKPVTDMKVQIDFMMEEFRTTEKSAYAAVKRADTPESAALAFQSKYERSAELGPRASNAAAWHAKLA